MNPIRELVVEGCWRDLAEPDQEGVSSVGCDRMSRKKPVHAKVRKPMPRKPPKVEVPKTVYRRRPKHVRPTETGT